MGTEWRKEALIYLNERANELEKELKSVNDVIKLVEGCLTKEELEQYWGE